MKIDLLGGSYKAPYPELNSQRTINWLPIVSTQPEQDKNQTALTPRPGLTLWATVPGRYWRQFFVARSQNYTKLMGIVDNVLYEIKPDTTITTIGTLTGVAKAPDTMYMEVNLLDQVAALGSEASYVYDMTAGTLTKITDALFPNKVSSSTYVDQYLTVVSDGAVFLSLTTGFQHWTGGETYSTTYKAAPTIAVASLREEIFNFTTETIECFYNDGTSPYSRLPRTSVKVGLAAKDSLATYKDGMVGIFKSPQGQIAVLFFDGYNNPQDLSKEESINRALNSGIPVEDAFAYIVQTKGNQYLYFLTIPTLDTTWVYSFTTNLWVEYQSLKPFVNDDGSQSQGMFRGKFFVNFNGMNLFADYYSGKIFKEDYGVNTEDGLYIHRERVSQYIANEDMYISHSKFVLDATTGGNPGVLNFSWSDDGGHLFNAPYEISLGNVGQYSEHIMLHNLGTSRHRVYKYVVTDDVAPLLQGSYLTLSSGTT